MREFGSDFHYIAATDFSRKSENKCGEYQLYANGRHAIQHLIAYKHWKRIWLPAYFCYDVVEAIKRTGIRLMFYPDAPGLDDNKILEKLNFGQKDVLLRMNYFGLRSLRDNSNLSVEVIEDHSHDLIGKWASKSNADWCIASLRKTIPMAEGGALWSPKQHKLPQSPRQTEENIQLADKRWQAMKLKRDYLKHHTGDKETFRKLYIESENAFEKLPISDLSEDCKVYLAGFDTRSWYQQKNKNWAILSGLQSNRIQILLPENKDCNLFSFVFLLKTKDEREQLRQHLIQNKLYPVVLWKIPELSKGYGLDISKRMLSIPCDARYSAADMMEIRKKLEKALEIVKR